MKEVKNDSKADCSVDQLPKEHQEALNEISISFSKIMGALNALHPDNRNKVSKKDKDSIIAKLKGSYINPIHNMFISLYIKAFGLEKYFTKDENTK